MTKMLSSILGMVLAFSIAIMLASAGSASSVLGATSSTGNASGNSAVKSSNMTSSGSMMNKTGVGNMSRAGNTTTLSGQGTPGAPFKPTGNMQRCN